jgi:ADP-heptose:LPS heptosyltransferase
LRLNAVLEAAGIRPATPRPVLPTDEAARAEVEGFMQTHALHQGRFVVMHAGASRTRQEKCWPGFEALAEALHASGLDIVWLGGADDRERNAALAARLGIDATERFTIPQLAALASHARFAVTNDSGPMHACAAAGVPVFALFGPSDWRRNHALGQGENVIAGVELLPDLYGLHTSDCLARVTPNHVLARIRDRGLLAAL